MKELELMHLRVVGRLVSKYYLVYQIEEGVVLVRSVWITAVKGPFLGYELISFPAC